MIDPTLSAILGVLWLVIGGAALGLMLRIYGRPVPTKGRRFAVKAHRALGWAYTVIYLFFLVIMARKLLDYGSLTPLQSIHMALGVSILPLLVTKILIVRVFKRLYRILPALGVTIFTIGFVVIVMGVTPMLIARATTPDTEGLTGEELIAVGEQLLEQRCQKCHDLDRVYDHKGRKTRDLWASTMDRMVKLEPPLTDVRRPILAFLQAEFAAPDTPEGVMLTGAALVEARCSKCHALDRVYAHTKTEDLWRATVRRYAELLPDHIRMDEIEPIVAFLYQKRGAPPDPDAHKRKLFEQHCVRCHNLSRALEIATEHELSPRRWKRTIRKMKRDAEERELKDIWTDEEAQTIAEWLSAQYSESADESEEK